MLGECVVSSYSLQFYYIRVHPDYLSVNYALRISLNT